MNEVVSTLTAATPLRAAQLCAGPADDAGAPDDGHRLRRPARRPRPGPRPRRRGRPGDPQHRGRWTPGALQTMATLRAIAEAEGGVPGAGWNLVVLQHTDCGITASAACPTWSPARSASTPRTCRARPSATPAPPSPSTSPIKANPFLPPASSCPASSTTCGPGSSRRSSRRHSWGTRPGTARSPPPRRRRPGRGLSHGRRRFRPRLSLPRRCGRKFMLYGRGARGARSGRERRDQGADMPRLAGMASIAPSSRLSSAARRPGPRCRPSGARTRSRRGW